MHVEHHQLPGRALGRPMEVREFGDRGQPLVAFPSQDGHASDFEGFGMIDACAPLIEAGRVRVLAVDGNDWESWTNLAVPAAQRARRHLDYDRWVMEEVVPFAKGRTGLASLWTTGCSMGAFHAANFFFRRPREDRLPRRAGRLRGGLPARHPGAGAHPGREGGPGLVRLLGPGREPRLAVVAEDAPALP
jgi:esterase/lipase superfamily enzyme